MSALRQDIQMPRMANQAHEAKSPTGPESATSCVTSSPTPTPTSYCFTTSYSSSYNAVVIGPNTPPVVQLTPQDEKELIAPLRPPFLCPFRGCGYSQAGCLKTLIKHGTSVHRWNLTSCIPSNNRATKIETAARGAGGGT